MTATIIRIPLEQVSHGKYDYRYHGDEARLIVRDSKALSYGLGCIRRGEEGRQVTGGPMVAGPWAYAFPHATVIDNHGGSGRQIDDDRAAGRVHETEFGGLIEIDGVTYRVEPHSRWDRVNIRLVPIAQK